MSFFEHMQTSVFKASYDKCLPSNQPCTGGAITPEQQGSHQLSHDVLHLDLEKFLNLTSCVDQS